MWEGARSSCHRGHPESWGGAGGGALISTVRPRPWPRAGSARLVPPGAPGPAASPHPLLPDTRPRLDCRHSDARAATRGEPAASSAPWWPREGPQSRAVTSNDTPGPVTAALLQPHSPARPSGCARARHFLALTPARTAGQLLGPASLRRRLSGVSSRLGPGFAFSARMPRQPRHWAPVPRPRQGRWVEQLLCQSGPFPPSKPRPGEDTSGCASPVSPPASSMAAPGAVRSTPAPLGPSLPTVPLPPFLPR